jgi:hypothetical protein
MSSNEEFAGKCLDLLKKPYIKNTIKEFIKPVIDIALQEIYPYIYLSVVFVIISFLLTLGIFILLVNRKCNCQSSYSKI